MFFARVFICNRRTIATCCKRLTEKKRLLSGGCRARQYSTASPDVLPEPHAEGSDKIYSPKIERLVLDISQLSLLEVADLNELLKKTLNIPDTPMMAMGSAASAAQPLNEEEEEAPRQEKVVFSVKLMNFEVSKKIQLIKAIKTLVPDMNLLQAKKFVESTPQMIKSNLLKEEAEKLRNEIIEAGGFAEIE